MSRRGYALPASLLALALLSALAALVLTRATLEHGAASRQLNARVAFEGALGAVASAPATWDSALAHGLIPGQAEALPSPWAGLRLETRDSLRRLGPSQFLVTSIGVVRAGNGDILAREGVAQVLTLTPPGGASLVLGGWWRWGR